MTSTGLVGGFGVGDTLLLLLVALVADAVLRWPPAAVRGLPHPLDPVRWLVGGLDRKLNRERRGQAARLVRGALVVVVVAALAAAAGWLVARFARAYPYGWIAELAVVAVLLGQRSTFERVRAVGRALASGPGAGREALAALGGGAAESDEHGVTRAAVEACARGFLEAVVGPAFWYVLLGLPGMFVYRAVNAMDELIGHRTSRHAAFGATAARLDDALGYLPARLAGVLLAAAALFVPTTKPGHAFRILFRDAGKHRSLNGGWTAAAMAGGLDLALGGPVEEGGTPRRYPWIGDGRARAGMRDVRRALFVFAVACVLDAGLVAALLALRIAV